MARHDEKRTAPRTTTVMPVKCIIIGHQASAPLSFRTAQAEGSEFPAKTINVSKEGILINCDSDLTVGTRLQIVMTAPTDGHQIHLHADVAWSRKNAMNLFGRYAAGLEIRKIEPEDRLLLTEYFQRPTE